MSRKYGIKGSEGGKGRGEVSVGQCKGNKEGGKSEEVRDKVKRRRKMEEAKK